MLLVALATYNEIENLPTLVAAIRAQLPDADVLVVDDNSPDGTGRWCDEEARTLAVVLGDSPRGQARPRLRDVGGDAGRHRPRVRRARHARRRLEPSARSACRGSSRRRPTPTS